MELQSRIPHKPRYVGHSLPLCWVWKSTCFHVFSYVAQILISGIDVGVKEGEHIRLYFNLRTDRAHLAEIDVLRAKVSLFVADHVL